MDQNDKQYKKYFKSITDGKKYLDYHKFCEELNQKPSSNKEYIPFVTQYENNKKNSFFHRPNNSPDMKF